MIVLNDDHNTFDHVAHSLARYIPGVTSDQGYAIADRIHNTGQAHRVERSPRAGRAVLGAAARRGADDGAARAGLTPAAALAQLVLGPLLRYTGATDATIWVQTDAACTVARLRLRGVARSRSPATTSRSCTSRAWSPARRASTRWRSTASRSGPSRTPTYPPSVIRTLTDDHGLSIAFGSCRVSVPHEPPYNLTKDEDDARPRARRALRPGAAACAREPSEEWPHLLVLLGDQVYADEVDPRDAGVRSSSRRDPSVPPGEQLADFEEYCHAYRVDVERPRRALAAVDGARRR